LKVLGNAGLDSTFAELAKIVSKKPRSAAGLDTSREGAAPKPEHSTFIRISAMDALRRMKSQKGMEIQRLLLPIYHDASEESSVRIAALWWGIFPIFLTQPISGM